MKQLIILAMMALAPIGTTTVHKPQAEPMVYICTGKSSKKFHATSNCMGLSNCSGTVKKVTKKEAVRLGRTPCKRCY